MILFDNGKNATGNSLDNSLTGNALANVLNGGAGRDELRGGSGNDTFVFVKGQAQGDRVMDFAGAGSAVGDKLEFRGYGTATISQVDGSDAHKISYMDGNVARTETIQLFGV
ncbi:hypothetical protein AB5I41_07720 [Sphingomonas sp. MMS24-JH45]